MEINGIAHIQITTGRYDVAREFYGKLLPFLGLRQVGRRVRQGFGSSQGFVSRGGGISSAPGSSLDCRGAE